MSYDVFNQRTRQVVIASTNLRFQYCTVSSEQCLKLSTIIFLNPFEWETFGWKS